MSPTRKQLAMRLKNARVTSGLTQEIVAKKARITRQYLYKLRGGQGGPHRDGPPASRKGPWRAGDGAASVMGSVVVVEDDESLVRAATNEAGHAVMRWLCRLAGYHADGRGRRTWLLWGDGCRVNAVDCVRSFSAAQSPRPDRRA